MKFLKTITCLTLLSILIFTLATIQPSTTSADPADNLKITGLVSNVLNLTYAEVEAMPMVWEIASLQCVGFINGTYYNWTGVPLFYFLELAGIQPEAKEVVFYAEDEFSSSITIDMAMHPTTLLALKVNGNTLPYDDGYWTGGLAGGYPYKAVIPCRWGYKWVGWIDEIEIVDYDYKGFYESLGYSDEAEIPDCTRLPNTHPAYVSFNATWRDIYPLTVFSNTTLPDASFNRTTKQIYLQVTNDNPNNSLYLVIPKRLLTMNYSVMINGSPTIYKFIEGDLNFLIYFNLSQGINSIEISGMLLADITGPINREPDGIVDMRDVGSIARIYTTEIGDPDYIPDYDLNQDGKIDMKDVGMVARDFGKIL
ncbi:MAG: molybdopterin-dependent oxidoreductase [Candidatus Bathyarchaeota archaeon]